MGKKEVIMTKEQAKLAKVQKGYVLEPVLGHMSQEEKLPEKRDRKKIQLFGSRGTRSQLFDIDVAPQATTLLQIRK